jgi:hypothetical protein
MSVTEDKAFIMSAYDCLPPPWSSLMIRHLPEEVQQTLRQPDAECTSSDCSLSQRVLRKRTLIQ